MPSPNPLLLSFSASTREKVCGHRAEGVDWFSEPRAGGGRTPSANVTKAAPGGRGRRDGGERGADRRDERVTQAVLSCPLPICFLQGSSEDAKISCPFLDRVQLKMQFFSDRFTAVLIPSSEMTMPKRLPVTDLAFLAGACIASNACPILSVRRRVSMRSPTHSSPWLRLICSYLKISILVDVFSVSLTVIIQAILVQICFSSATFSDSVLPLYLDGGYSAKCVTLADGTSVGALQLRQSFGTS